jgi:hypothetical protein
MAKIGDNRLTALAGQVSDLHRQVTDHTRAAAEKALQAGAALLEAKRLLPHGQWGTWLARAGINDRTAQRYMRLARSPLTSDIVSDLGGVSPALAFLSRWKAPEADQALFIFGDLDRAADIAYVWEDRRARGHFHVFGIFADGDGKTCIATKRPMLWHAEIEGEQPVDLILTFLRQAGFPAPIADWKVEAVERRLAEAVAEPMMAAH